MKLRMELGEHSYDIVIKRGCLAHINEYVDLNRKVLVIRDEGVPATYATMILDACKHGFEYVIPQGEDSKSFPVYERLCGELLLHHFTRKDVVIALGGGVVGDLAGFVASSYMRGIDFIQVPTTTLSQIDSSIGGKVAINLGKVKNIIGAFYQPKCVLIDPDTLQTLPRRHYINGLVEAIKAGLIYDKDLFTLFEQGNVDQDIEQIIKKALLVKKCVVEQDEKEMGLRKILNFGHTIGHAIESAYGLQTYYHGECVALGMLFFIQDEDLKDRVRNVYKKLGLMESVPYDPEEILKIMRDDKKAGKETIDVIEVATCGEAVIHTVDFPTLATILKGNI